jgi:hypothetical protein
MARADVDEAIQKGLEVWSKVTPLIFTKISKGIADIMIAFKTRGKVFSRESNIAIFILGALTRLILLPPVSQSMVRVLVTSTAPWESSAMPFPLVWDWVETLTLMRMRTGPRTE